ncbi:MAG: ImmA/IrrE family metallo-endopeptidase [Thiofilum sp.]|nr:ImmA/IrrE family metallo-endopeptidase [Thiofilum sp.]
MEEQKGAYEAEQLLEELGFDTLPISPWKVAESIDSDGFRLVLEKQNFSSQSILGKAEGNHKGALVYVNANISDSRRLNFTVSHEIRHVCMHIMPQRKLSFECGKKEMFDFFNDPIEKEANGFASGLLMPKRLIYQHYDGDVNWLNISTISELCGTSLEATYRRMSVLDSFPSALVVHQDSKFKRFVVTPNFGFRIEKTVLASYQLALAAVIKDEPYPSEYEIVNASDWIDPSFKGTTLEKIYSSTIILKGGFTYTLLRYDDDCIRVEDDETQYFF